MKLSKILYVITILSALGLSSCNQLFESFLDEDNSTEQAQQTDGSGQNVQITVSLPSDLTLNTTDDDSRSAMTSFPTLTYKAVATTNGLSTVTQTSSTSSIGISLTTGHTWTITIGAYSGTTLILQGSKTISITGPLAETIPLSVYTGTGAASGSIELTLSTSDSSFDNYSYTFTNKTGNAAYTGTSTISSGANITLSTTPQISASDVSSGTYGLIITFYSGTTIVYCLSTDITVYPSLTTSIWNLDEGVTNGTFTLTQALIDDQKSSVFYVCGDTPSVYGTSITPITADDSNSGGVYTPLASIASAISKCTSTGKKYSIFVDGTLTETSVINISASTNITIKSLGESAKIIKDSELYYTPLINISSGATLTMTNITMDGNKENCTEGMPSEGGGIDTEGTFTLNNCTIQNCESGYYGGGIYSSGTLTLNDCTIKNCESKNGGGIYIASGAVVMTGGVIGDATATTTATSDNCSNTATNGGGVYVGGDGKFTITSGIIGRNYTSEAGGGIYYNSSSVDSEIEGGYIQYNSSKDGGGIHIAKGAVVMTGGVIGDTTTTKTATSSDCSNIATSCGGGVNVAIGTFTLKSGTIGRNYASASGGGIYYGSTSTNSSIDGGSIQYNTANSHGGGGVCVANSCTVTFTDGSISYNNATGGEYGGGVLIENSDDGNSPGIFKMTGEDCIICNNTAGKWAGAVRILGTFIMGGGEISGNSSDDVDEGCGGVTIHNTTSTFEFTGGVIKDNLRASSKDSPGIFISSSDGDVPTFEIGGSAYIEGENYIYFNTDNTKKITITSALTGTTTPVATIVPSSYTTGVQVLAAGTGVTLSDWVGKFKVKQQTEGAICYIDADGKIQEVTDLSGVSNVSSVNYLQAVLEYIETNNITDKVTMTVSSNMDITSNTLTIPSGSNIVLTSTDAVTFTCGVNSDKYKHITVESGATLTLSGNITLQGEDFGNNEQTGLYILGTVNITDSVTISSFGSNGNGSVYIASGGNLTMSGGTITNCSARYGGGVYIASKGTFNMTGGSITGNRAENGGNAIALYGTFNWSGGTITNNGTGGTDIYSSGSGTLNNTSGNTAS